MLESYQQCLVSSSGDPPCWGNGCSNQPVLPSLEKLPVRTSCPLGIACALAAAQFEKPSVQSQSNQEWRCECLHTPAKPQQPDASAQSSARKGLVGNGELVDSTLMLGKFSAPNLAWNCIVSAAPHARPFLSTIGHPMQSVDPARSFEGGKEVFFSSHTTHHKRERAHWGNVSRILWTAAGSRRASAAIHGSVPLVSGRTREATVPGAGRYWWRRWTHQALGTLTRFPRKSSSCSLPNRRPARAWPGEKEGDMRLPLCAQEQ